LLGAADPGAIPRDPALSQSPACEAQALARLSHPNVVQIYEVGEVGDQLFVAMEFITGDTLRAWMERGDHDWRRTVGVFVEAGQGLAAAHAAALIHRDFKPENVAPASSTSASPSSRTAGPTCRRCWPRCAPTHAPAVAASPPPPS